MNSGSLKHFLNRRKALLLPLFLFLLCLLISFLNFKPGTFLTGWDTLHPEFDFSLNFQRLIFGVWRPEQGLGALTGHSAMADLPRVVILWLLHFILPLNTLRYAYIFLCLIAGPLGMYFLVFYLLSRRSHYPYLIAFIAALAYLFNLGTLQQFYVPFEMFPTQWAFLPWVILYTLKFLDSPGIKNILLFAFFQLLIIPQAYAAHLWYPFFGVYCLFLFIYWLSCYTPQTFAKITVLALLTVAFNSFWLLPNLYYIKTSSSVPQENKTNRLHSQEYLLQNRATGTIKDVALDRGFYFNWEIFDFTTHSAQDLLLDWKDHLTNQDVLMTGYLIFNLCLLGIFLCVYFRNKRFSPFIPFFLIPFILLANITPPFNLVFNLLIRSPVLEEALRFVYSKVSILYIFGVVVYLAFTLDYLSAYLHHLQLKNGITAFIILSLFIYAYPFFQGSLISDKLKIAIPPGYFQFWDYMHRQPPGKVLTLPLNAPSGWQYYSWGYQGSGLIWFGLPQSVLDRDFDRWEPKNEEAYRELFNALYQNDANRFRDIVTKYNISYILWDQSSITTDTKNQDQITFKYQIEKILSDLTDQGYLTSSRQFGSLLVYQLISPPALVEVKPVARTLGPAFHWGFTDSAYLPTDPYSTSSTGNNVYYPFRDLLTHNDKIDQQKLSITPSTTSWKITTDTPPLPLQYPDLTAAETILPANLFVSYHDAGSYRLYIEFPLPNDLVSRLHTQTLISFAPGSSFLHLQFNDRLYTFDVSRLNSTPLLLGSALVSSVRQNIINNRPFDFGFADISRITTSAPVTLNTTPVSYSAAEILDQNPGAHLVADSAAAITYHSLDTTNGTSIHLAGMEHSLGYIIGFKSQFQSGIPLRFCLKNDFTGICSFEDELSKNRTLSWDYFLIPPTDSDSGYDILLNAVSYGGFETRSRLAQMVIIPLPYNFLSRIASVSPAPLAPVAAAPAVGYQTHYPNFYEIPITSSMTGQTLIFNQSFHPGWQAFYYQNGQKIYLTSHTLINNWANGWKLPASNLPSAVYIYFWPQNLEFIGFGLLALSLFSLPVLGFFTKRLR